MPKIHDLKVVVVGDGFVGKTCLILRCAANMFPYDYMPCIYDNYTKDMIVDEHQCSLHLWDTAGHLKTVKILCIIERGLLYKNYSSLKGACI